MPILFKEKIVEIAACWYSQNYFLRAQANGLPEHFKSVCEKAVKKKSCPTNANDLFKLGTPDCSGRFSL